MKPVERNAEVTRQLMSATRDPSEKITFLFTPMGQLVQKIAETPLPDVSERPAPATRSRVLKSADLRQASTRPGLVRDYRAPDIQRRVPREAPGNAPIPESLARQLDASNVPLNRQRRELHSLRKSLDELQGLEKRLQFLLLDLEELLKD